MQIALSSLISRRVKCREQNHCSSQIRRAYVFMIEKQFFAICS